MTEAVTVALITGGISLVGIIVSGLITANKTSESIRLNQAVTDTKLDNLTREVREHNGFAQRIPVAESKIHALEARMLNVEQKLQGGA